MVEGMPPVDQHTDIQNNATDAAFTLLSVGWNDTIYDFPDDRCIHHLFEEQAAQTPNALAVFDQHTSLTYAALNSRANQVAHALIGLGVGPETRVAILAERSAEMIVGLLGILKAGGAYVPLDPAYPAERLAFMLHGVKVPVVLTQRRLLPILPQPTRALCLDDLAASECAENPASAVDPCNLAYVIYTSGSTGQPKGVMISHQSVMNLVSWHQHAFTITAADRATQLAGPAYDAAAWEIWPYLLSGASIAIPDDETRAQAARLQSWLIDQEITISFAPTPLAERLIALDWPEHTPLRFLLTGGDALQRYPERLPFKLVNHYGLTECTVITTAGIVPHASNATTATPPIGYPIDNAAVLILDPQLRPVPAGTSGEIYIAGVGLARGYLDRPDLTASTFVPNPFSDAVYGIPGTRLYKTGDLARWQEDGAIEFLDRVDH